MYKNREDVFPPDSTALLQNHPLNLENHVETRKVLEILRVLVEMLPELERRKQGWGDYSFAESGVLQRSAFGTTPSKLFE